MNQAMGSPESQGGADQQAQCRLAHMCAHPVIPAPPPCKADAHYCSETRQKLNLDLCIQAALRRRRRVKHQAEQDTPGDPER